MRWLALIIAVTHLIGCNTRKASKLEQKARCAAIGRTFIRDLQRQNGGVPAVGNATFAYNSAADTCLCRYEAHWNAKGAGSQYVIVDILSNATIASYDTTISDGGSGRSNYEAASAAMTDDRPIPPSSK